MGQAVIELQQVAKTFRSADGRERPVLEGVDFTLREGEIVALLGPSGSGKSTLLRIMAGLVAADHGQVNYRGQPLYAPARAISMVFQSFALFPWLTVQQNVELGLEARGLPPAERGGQGRGRDRAHRPGRLRGRAAARTVGRHAPSAWAWPGRWWWSRTCC